MNGVSLLNNYSHLTQETDIGITKQADTVVQQMDKFLLYQNVVIFSVTCVYEKSTIKKVQMCNAVFNGNFLIFFPILKNIFQINTLLVNTVLFMIQNRRNHDPCRIVALKRLHSVNIIRLMGF